MNENEWRRLLEQLRGGVLRQGYADFDAAVVASLLEEGDHPRRQFIRYASALRDELVLRSGLPALRGLDRLREFARAEDLALLERVELVEADAEGRILQSRDLTEGVFPDEAVRSLDTMLQRAQAEEEAAR